MTREEAIEWLECLETLDKEQDVAREMAIEALQERKTGKWKLRTDTMYHYECPFCGYLHQYKDNFCPLCGAKMKEEQNNADSN